MQFKTTVFCLICLMISAGICFAQEDATSAEDVNEPVFPPFPYIAQVAADNVNIRSGPGTNYYSCGKLSKANRVKAVGRKFSWSQIVPPEGSFSWISKQYVEIDPNEPGSGIVTGDNVRVYAGSAHLKPIHSTTMQLKLNKTDKVKLTGEEKGDYYKITPPSGAYLWVSTQYIEPLGPADQVPLNVKSEEIDEQAPAVIRSRLPVEAEKLKEYNNLAKQVLAERDKPIAEQNYENIKKALAELAANKETGKAGRYSEFALKQIDRYELAVAVAKEVPLQAQSLRQIKDRIEKARQAKLANLVDMGRFTAVGVLQTSGVYDAGLLQKYYRLIDEQGKTICYILPEGSAVEIDPAKFIDEKIGVVGTIEPHVATSSALVRFTEIEELE